MVAKFKDSQNVRGLTFLNKKYTYLFIWAASTVHNSQLESWTESKEILFQLCLGLIQNDTKRRFRFAINALQLTQWRHRGRWGRGVRSKQCWPMLTDHPYCSAGCCVFVCAVKQESGQPVAVYPWHCLVPFLASSSSSSTPATAQRQQQQQQIASTHPADTSPAASAGRVIGLSWQLRYARTHFFHCKSFLVGKWSSDIWMLWTWAALSLEWTENAPVHDVLVCSLWPKSIFSRHWCITGTYAEIVCLLFLPEPRSNSNLKMLTILSENCLV